MYTSAMSPRRPFSNAELASIQQLPHSRTKTLLICGILTGYRISELLSWRIKDVYNGIAIRHKVTVEARYMKNKHSPRTVILHPAARSILATLIQPDTNPLQYVFRSREGINQPICLDTANRNIKSVCAIEGISERIGTHSMRKTYARLLYRASGNDIIVLKEGLGHRDVKTTQKYLEVEEGKVDALMSVMLCSEGEIEQERIGNLNVSR